MCDDQTVVDNNAFAARRELQSGGITRRKLGIAGAGLATYSALTAYSAQALDTQAKPVKTREVSVPTPAGQADAYFASPATGKHPGVIIWPDVLGLRPAFELMAERLAQAGYAVLVINPYYREAKAPVVAPGDSFQHAAVRAKVLPFARKLNPQTVVADAQALVTFLDDQAEVDTSRGIGTMGYCMGGPFTIRTAAALPDRIAAGASFHGGRLVTDGADSPHLLVPQMQANFLFAIAENDDDKDPAAKSTLADSFAAAGLDAEIEVYQGALHGWCPPDSVVYDEALAERAWSRLLVLFEGALQA